MSDPPRYPPVGDDSETAEERTARWVYVLMGVFVLLVVVFVTLHLTGVLGPGSH